MKRSTIVSTLLLASLSLNLMARDIICESVYNDKILTEAEFLNDNGKEINGSTLIIMGSMAGTFAGGVTAAQGILVKNDTMLGVGLGIAIPSLLLGAATAIIDNGMRRKQEKSDTKKYDLQSVIDLYDYVTSMDNSTNDDIDRLVDAFKLNAFTSLNKSAEENQKRVDKAVSIVINTVADGYENGEFCKNSIPMDYDSVAAFIHAEISRKLAE